ncbi:ABC transporter [Microbacterium memoriense]|uniref:ABC transporter n=1 Tax=Microbacterium memoriense TaxID=2978350 RepID=A0ABT2PB18_9MICO|nr:ABC transporter [Microbacterium memoriense]MCT9001800.1 ABC transporter [Microbacterium memoriense]
MSDPKYGDPVDETHTDDAAHGDDVVGRVNESLAEAEAASRDAVDTPPEHPVAADHAEHVDTAAHAEPVAPEHVETVAAEPAADPLYRGDDLALDYSTGAAAVAPAAGAVAPTAVVTPSEPVVPVVAPAPQPIFVQAPEAPRPRGNRAAAGLIGLLAALTFGVLYLAASLGFRAITGDVTGANVGTEALAALTTWWFWVPVVVFFISFWLLGAIINRGRWAYWVIFGLLVGVASYGGHLLGQLFQAPFWTLTAREGADLVEGQLLAPLAIAAFVIGREITIWFGAWVSSRGARVTEINNEAQREYERTLEAGPRLHQS